MKCLNCGAELKKESVFCSYCGAKVTGTVIDATDDGIFSESRFENNIFSDSKNTDSWDELNSFFEERSQNQNEFNSGIDSLFDDHYAKKSSYNNRTATNYKSPSERLAKVSIVLLSSLIALILLFTLFNIIIFKATDDGKMIEYKAAINRIIRGNSSQESYNSGYEQETEEYHYEYDNTGENSLPSTYTDNNNLQYPTQNKSDDNLLNSFSSENIRLLNIFLSNFAEAGVKDISSGKQNQMIDFVIEQAIINNPSKIYELGNEAFTSGGTKYDRYIDAYYVNERVKRYFDISVNDSSTDTYLFESGKYYIPDDIANVSSYFSKAYKATGNSDGTLTVYFKNYDCKGLEIDTNIYRGIGDENIGKSKVVGAGKATLKEKYFGEKYANYIILDYTLTEGRDYNYINTKVVSFPTPDNTLPDE